MNEEQNNFNTQANNVLTREQPLNNQSFNNMINSNEEQNQNIGGPVSSQTIVEPIAPTQQ